MAWTRVRDDVRPAAFTWADFEVELLSSPLTLEAEWRAIEGSGVTSIYQTWAYINDWLRTAASASGETPIFRGRPAWRADVFHSAARSSHGRGRPCARWLGQAHSNYGMGLYRRELLEAQRGLSFDRLIREIGKKAGAHLVHLDMQAGALDGLRQPVHADTREPAHGQRHLPRASRRGLRGPVQAALFEFKPLQDAAEVAPYRRAWPDRVPASQTEGARIAALDWFIDIKGEQLLAARLANPFAPDYIRKFYYALSRSESFHIDQLVVNGTREALGFSVRERGNRLLPKHRLCDVAGLALLAGLPSDASARVAASQGRRAVV